MRIIMLALCTLAMSACSKHKQDVYVIDFATQHGSRFIHGTLSTLDGDPKSTWTIHEQERKNAFDSPVTQTEFQNLWETIANTTDLDKYAVLDKETRLSFSDHYILNMTWSLSDDGGSRTYLIPHNDSSKSVAQLMRRIESLSEQQ